MTSTSSPPPRKTLFHIGLDFYLASERNCYSRPRENIHEVIPLTLSEKSHFGTDREKGKW